MPAELLGYQGETATDQGNARRVCGNASSKQSPIGEQITMISSTLASTEKSVAVLSDRLAVLLVDPCEKDEPDKNPEGSPQICSMEMQLRTFSSRMRELQRSVDDITERLQI